LTFLTNYADLEQRVLVDVIDSCRQLWAPYPYVASESPWECPLPRRKREQIATAMRDAAEILSQADGLEPLLVLDDMVNVAVQRGFVPDDLASVDICVALATASVPGVRNLPNTGRVLIRAARFARMPALPCPWSVNHWTSVPRTLTVETGRLSSRRPNLQNIPRR
jgi:hypothetical protein